ncbi:MAG TPA: pitrilysin family protein [Anaeromyxobacteraceae bacterium]|nr:pitrilysin family protein [Anaeromyxobacteraceae bacterium]
MRRAKRSSGPFPQMPGRAGARGVGFPERERAVLPNGVTVVATRTPGLHSAMVAVYVRAGSRHETRELNGVSHFLEHLLFRGSEGYPETLVMNAAVESAGGSLNAMTARDHSCYYTPIHPSALETGITVLADIIRRPLLRGMDVERQVILEEILDEVDSNGRDVDPDNLAKRLAFGPHPLGYKIAGTPRTIRKLREPDVRRHHAALYTGPNVVLAAAGPAPFEEVLAIARRQMSAIPAGAPSAAVPAPRWPIGPLYRAIDHDDAQTEFTLAFPSVPEQNADHPATLCLRRLLDDGLSSRLPYEIIEQKGLAYTIHAGLETFEDTGLFTFDGACSPGKLGLVISEILSLLVRLREEPVPDDELERGKRRHRLSLTFALDNPYELAGWIGTGEILGWPETLEQRCRRVERVTAADVRRVARRMFQRRNLLAVAVGPDGRSARRALVRAVESSGLP